MLRSISGAIWRGASARMASFRARARLSSGAEEKGGRQWVGRGRRVRSAYPLPAREDEVLAEIADAVDAFARRVASERS